MNNYNMQDIPNLGASFFFKAVETIQKEKIEFSRLIAIGTRMAKAEDKDFKEFIEPKQEIKEIEDDFLPCL